MKNVGEKIKAARKDVGLTQQQLADRTDLTRNYIAMIENGRKSPSLSAISSISSILRVKPIDILSGTPELTVVRENLIKEFGGLQNLREIVDHI